MEKLSTIISSYCDSENELYNEIAEELSDYFHKLNSEYAIQPSDLTYNALACLAKWEQDNEDRKRYQERYLGSLITMI